MRGCCYVCISLIKSGARWSVEEAKAAAASINPCVVAVDASCSHWCLPASALSNSSSHRKKGTLFLNPALCRPFSQPSGGRPYSLPAAEASSLARAAVPQMPLLTVSCARTHCSPKPPPLRRPHPAGAALALGRGCGCGRQQTEPLCLFSLLAPQGHPRCGRPWGRARATSVRCHYCF